MGFLSVPAETRVGEGAGSVGATYRRSAPLRFPHDRGIAARVDDGFVVVVPVDPVVLPSRPLDHFDHFAGLPPPSDLARLDQDAVADMSVHPAPPILGCHSAPTVLKLTVTLCPTEAKRSGSSGNPRVEL
jgi:hypothetical protein